MSNILLLPLKWLLICLDFTLFAVTFGWIPLLKKLMKGTPMRSVPVDGADESHRVAASVKETGLLTKVDGLETLYEISSSSFQRFADKKCMGTRAFLGQHSPTVKHFGNVSWKTYGQVGEESHKFGAALRGVGLVPAPDTTSLQQITTPCALAIFENTCAPWMISALGSFTQSIIVTTIYATLGMDAVIHAVNDGVISAILCNKSNVHNILSRSKDMPTLKTIIYTNDLVAPDSPPLDISNSNAAGLKVVSFEDFVASGDTTAYPPSPPKPGTCAVIMYTSGSTGKPKGVVVKHSHIVAAIAGAVPLLGLTEKDDYLGYLPLAHILELMAEFSFLSVGSSIGYADPKTLSATGAYPVGALEQFKPTVMAAVPKIWDIFKKAVQGKVSKGSPVVKFLFSTAFEAKAFAVKHGYDTPLFNALIFKKMKKVLGGRMRLAMSGGGPLNKEVQEFIRTCFSMPLVQGYGLTETCAGLTIQAQDDLRFQVAGVPINSLEVKLESTPDIMDKAGFPYLCTDRVDVDGNPVFGRGEILARGGNISLGYYMEEKKTMEEFQEDGFFHTGDIGQFMEDGSIRIVDRKKNLVKLKGGEYIAVEHMEMVYGNSKYVNAINGGVCCYGDGDMDRPVALMQINEPIVMEWAASNNIDGDFATIIETKDLMDAVMDDLMTEWKKGGLSSIEKLVGVVFLTEPFTPENGCLTAANKLQRRTVISKFEKEFESVKAKGIR